MVRIPHGRYSRGEPYPSAISPPPFRKQQLSSSSCVTRSRNSRRFLRMDPQSTRIFPRYCLLPPILLLLAYTGMILADAGFDVFMLNVRGTRYSQKHVNLTIDDRDFWKYTFDFNDHSVENQLFRVDDMAKFDAPAAIDRVLSLNGAQSLYYIGHSQVLDCKEQWKCSSCRVP